MENTTQISIKDLWLILKKNLIWIIAVALVVGCAAALGGELLIKDQYNCTATYMLGDANMTSTEYAQLGKNAQRAKLVLRTREVISQVVEKAQIYDEKSGTLAVNAMRSATSISASSDAGSYTITVSTESPVVSYAMVLAFDELMPTLIEENGLFAARRIDISPKAPTSPSNSGRALRYGAIGLVIGAILAYAFFFLKKITDVKIHNVEDLKSVTDLPVIGVIPVYSSGNGEKTDGEASSNA